MLGVTRFGLARYGKVWVSRLGGARCCAVMLGVVGVSWSGLAR